MTLITLILALFACTPHDYESLEGKERIVIGYANEETYAVSVLSDNRMGWVTKANGVKENNDPYDFVLPETGIIMWTNRDMKSAHIILAKHKRIEIPLVNPRHFIYDNGNELDDYTTIEIQY